LERALYRAEDYQRFQGQLAKIKLSEPLTPGQRTIRGTIAGLNEDGQVVLQIQDEQVAIDLAKIESARLLFEWNKGPGPQAKRSKKKPERKAARGVAPSGSQQSR
jgi:hypothetical protein